MNRAAAVLAVSMALSLAGCVLGGKDQTAKNTPPAPQPAPKTEPAAQTGPLSVAQTQVQLPPPQAVDPEALTAVDSTEPPVETPAAPQPSVHRRMGPPPVATKPAVEAAPATVTPPPEPERPAIQEIVPEAEHRRLQEQADASKREVKQLLDQLRNRQLSQHERGVVKNIESFIKLSDDAEAKSDMLAAKSAADRALVLAKELQNGRE